MGDMSVLISLNHYPQNPLNAHIPFMPCSPPLLAKQSHHFIIKITLFKFLNVAVATGQARNQTDFEP